MKRYRTFLTCLWLSTAALLLSACARATLWELETVSDGSSVGTQQDSCYVNLHIVNSSQLQTRAAEPATAAENAIYDGILAIFEGTDAATSTLKTAVVIDQLINNPGSSTSVDVTQRLAVGTHPYQSGQNLYVLALLNTTPSGFTVEGTTLKFNGTSQTGSTLNEIQSLTINSVGSTDKHVGLFMSNSNGLVEATALFDTESAARAGSAARVTINVERAAAKVKVTNGISTTLNSIKLNGNNDSHPTVHRISWALASEASDGFSLYQQKTHQSGDVLYLPENTATKTSIIVETQLKDGSFLLDDCYKFAWSDYLYTSASQFIQFLKDGWGTQNWGALSTYSGEEIYGHMKLELADNGHITVTFTNTSGYSGVVINKLAELKTFIEDNTIGFREGKMYYTYELNQILHNNVYNLTLQPGSITAIGRPTP